MNILQVSSLYYPHKGGIERHVECLSKSLVKDGHKVTIYTSNVLKCPNYEIKDGVKIIRFKCFSSLFNNQFSPGIFLKLIKNNNFDIVHIHSYLHMSSNFAVISNIIKNKPIVLTAHGSIEFDGSKQIISIFYNKFISKFMLNSANKIIAVSINDANALKKLGAKEDRIIVIPHGIHLNKVIFEPEIESFKKKYKIIDKKIVLFVGGIIPRKGIEYLIMAMQYTNFDSILLIVGSELNGYLNYKKTLDRLVDKLNLTNKVIFIGSLSDEDLALAYSSCDVFVLPSISEVFGLVILEAMLFKKCVIASNVSGPASIINNYKNGILFEPKNVHQLAEKIDEIIADDGMRQRISKNAYDHVIKNYSWEASYKKTIDIYEEIIR